MTDRLELEPNTCFRCGKPLTWWVRLKRLFWAPWWCATSYVWRSCCSQKCCEARLVAMLRDLGNKEVVK